MLADEIGILEMNRNIDDRGRLDHLQGCIKDMVQQLLRHGFCRITTTYESVTREREVDETSVPLLITRQTAVTNNAPTLFMWTKVMTELGN
jgi:hypothetical protein